MSRWIERGSKLAGKIILLDMNNITKKWSKKTTGNMEVIDKWRWKT